jgi:LPXTG-motif cell wall-anchored protein
MRAKRAVSTIGALAAAGAGVVVTGGTAQAAPYVPCPPPLRMASAESATATAAAVPAAPTPWLQDCLPPPTGIGFHPPHRHRHHEGCYLCPIGHGRHRRVTEVLIDEPPYGGPSDHTALPDTGAKAAVAVGLIGTTLLSVGGLITAGRHRRPRW